MKKIIVLILIIFINNSYANAIEEVILEKNSLDLNYLSNIYYGKVEDKNEISPILRLFSKDGLEFENSKINKIKATFLYSGHLSYGNTNHNGQFLSHDFHTVEPMVSIYFNENKSKFMFDINLTRSLEGYSNWFTQRISQIYFSHQINPNQKIVIGQYGRIPNSFDGSRSTWNQEMVLKSQLGRTLGDSRSVGLKNIGHYKYFDYDIGIYDSTRYMKDFGKGADFTGYFMIKPLANISEKTGELKIGSGYNIGENNISYNIYSFMLGYDYKKFHTHIEYANANGYNAIQESNNDADGFYTLVSYDITPKLTILGRYDIFDYNKHISNDNVSEYTIGISYNIFTNMKLMLNYVRRDYENMPDSNLILFATRFFI